MYCGWNDLARTIIVEILHCGEGGDVEQVARTSEQILSCLRLLISLSIHLCLYLACSYCYYLYCLIFICALFIYLLGIV